ncbi:hypothetical protein ACS0TY_021403 [Phlomoides rotata]
MTTLLEKCRISPPPGAAAGLTVSLSFQDIIWINYHPTRHLLFYDYPCSKSDFMETIVPKLKESLSLTLQNYLPVAGNLLYPSDTEKMPVIRYVSGDSVPLVIAESSNDFDELVGNHARDADQFYDLVPQMPPVIDDPDYKIVPVLALQLTLFPGRGICLGFANYHTLGDASSIVGFMSAWASVNRIEDCKEIVRKEGESLPFFDRSVMKDSIRIGSILWETMRKVPFETESFPLPTNRVRATFVLTLNDITKLKKMVLEKKPGIVQVSSFVVTASYVWSCLVKSVNEEVTGDVAEFFVFPVDARGRVDPPVPANFFGNCLGYGVPEIEHEKLVGEDGFVIAAEAIAEEIKNRVNKKNELLKEAENWASEWEKFMGIRALGVSGSPKFDLPNVDFGWGKARKLEVVHIDGEKYTMSICKSRNFEGGLEIGLSLPKEMMEAFASIFANGLSS